MERQQYIEAVEKYGNTVYRVAYQYCGNQSDAEDIVQNVFLKLLQIRKSFEDEEYLRRWLIRVAVNEAKNLSMSFWKRRMLPLEQSKDARVGPFAGQSGCAVVGAYGAERAYELSSREHSELYEAVMALAPKYRIVVHLYYFEDYSVKEIAKLLGIRETTIQTQLMRARAKLKEDFADGEATGTFQDCCVAGSPNVETLTYTVKGSPEDYTVEIQWVSAEKEAE